MRTYGPLSTERIVLSGGQWDPLQIPASQQIAWYRETYTNTGGAVNPWTDKWVGNDLANATAANRPIITDPDAVFNNLPSYLGDGTDVLIATAGTEANFRPLSDGTGFFAHLIWRGAAGALGEEYLFGTCSGTAQTGMFCMWNDINLSLRIMIANGVTSILDIATANGTFVADTVHRTCIWVKDGLAPSNEFEVWDSAGVPAGAPTLMMSGTILGAFAAGNPTSRLVTFRIPSTGSNYFNGGKYNELMLCTNVGLVNQSMNYMIRRVP